MNTIIIKIILSAVASLLHTLGFYVLWNVRQSNPYMATQRLYLMLVVGFFGICLS